MTLAVMGPLPGEVRDEVETATSGLRGLEDVVRWGLCHTPRLVIEEVVTQDEYTHDVVLPYPGGLYLVFDTT